ncbi:MAG: hypothetical protein R3E39_22100 [Anaerolineae bacterium]
MTMLKMTMARAVDCIERLKITAQFTVGDHKKEEANNSYCKGQTEIGQTHVAESRYITDKFPAFAQSLANRADVIALCMVLF